MAVQLQVLIERITGFDTTPREVPIRQTPVFLIEFGQDQRWSITRELFPGNSVLVNANAIPVGASREDLAPVLSLLPAPQEIEELEEFVLSAILEEGAQGPQGKLTKAEIEKVTGLIFDTVGSITASIFDGRGLPIFRSFASLSASEQTQAFDGLSVRIEREGLRNYIERKRSGWGQEATNAVIGSLTSQGLLRD